MKVTTLDKVAHSLDKKSSRYKHWLSGDRHLISGEFELDIELEVGESEVGNKLPLLDPSLSYLSLSVPFYFEYYTDEEDGPIDLGITSKVQPYYDKVKVSGTSDTNVSFTEDQLKKWLNDYKDLVEAEIEDHFIGWVELNWADIERDWWKNQD